jgi:hypothetical protein
MKPQAERFTVTREPVTDQMVFLMERELRRRSELVSTEEESS